MPQSTRQTAPAGSAKPTERASIKPRPVQLNYDDLGELGRITAPTMLIWGDGDGLVGRQMQDQLTELIAGAELLVYTGIGHTPRWEDGLRFASDIAAFIERLRHA